MKQFSYVLTNDHARHQYGSSQLTHEASRFSSEMLLLHQGKAVALIRGRALSALDMKSGHSVTVTVEGKDEEAAVAAIQNYFVANM